MEDKNPHLEKKRLLGSGLSRQDASHAVRRMLAGVPAGTAPSNRALRSGGAEAETARYDEAFRRTENRLGEAHERVKRERTLAGLQWDSLAGHPPARRMVMVRNDERLHHWGLYDLLLEKSRAAAEADASTAAVGLAELALAVAERLDSEVYGEERLADFKTGALAALGDARRRSGDFAGARLAFSQARMHLEMGTGDLLEEAGLLGGLVSLLCDLGEYEKAAHSLDRASSLYRRMGDSHLDGVTVLRPQEEDEAGEPENWQGIGIG